MLRRVIHITDIERIRLVLVCRNCLKSNRVCSARYARPRGRNYFPSGFVIAAHTHRSAVPRALNCSTSKLPCTLSLLLGVVNSSTKSILYRYLTDIFDLRGGIVIRNENGRPANKLRIS